MITHMVDERRRPFQIVALLTLGIAFSGMVSALVIYVQTGQLQTLALMGIATAVVVSAGVGWLRVQTRGRIDQAIWLIVSSEIAGVIIASLIVADFTPIGLILIAAIPFQVGIVDQIRRVPLFLVLSLLGAAGMIASELLALPDRLSIGIGQPALLNVINLGLLVHLIVLLGVLWYYRLRRDAPLAITLDLATQQSLGFTGIAALSIVLVTSVFILQIRDSQISQVGQNFQTIAEINGERVGNALEQQINSLRELGRRETVLLEGLTTANASYPANETERKLLLQERERLWQETSETSDFVLAYRSNPQTLELSKFRGADLLHNNVLLTDRYGGLVAGQGEKPPHYYYGDEAWWQTTWNDSQGDIYIGQLAFNEDTGLPSVFIAVGVLDSLTNQTVGILASTYDLRSIQRDIAAARSQVSGDILLANPEGIIIAATNAVLNGQAIWDTAVALNNMGDNPLPTSNWILGADRHQNPAVIGTAALRTTTGLRRDVFEELGWRIIVSDTQANALAQVTRSTQIASLVGLLVMALGVITANATSRVITRPIDELTKTAAAISAGDLERQAQLAGPVELTTLAEAFNKLTGQLRSLINNLQAQVNQRTQQLEARIEQLATLNRITTSVVAIREAQSTLETVAYEIAQLLQAANCSLALMTDDRENLRVVAEHDSNPTTLSALGTVVPLRENPGSLRAIETGRSIIIQDVEPKEQSDLIRRLIRQHNASCLLGVPLLSRGEAIGMIWIVANERERQFTSSEIELAETIAGQIAGAIENVRLFDEMQKAKEVAEAANETKSAFLASVSHELRTPLTSVLGFAKIVQKRFESRILPNLNFSDSRIYLSVTQIQENMNIIISEGERLTTLINNVLDLAKIEAGKIEWNMKPVSAHEVIDHAAAATRALFEQKRTLELIQDVENDLPEIVGDYDKLMQVVINLISNAVKFTETGSITCRVRQTASDLVFSVTDTGIGILLEDTPKIFEKFTQVGDTLTEKPRGTGLGLTISKEIIEYHGGRIWVESEAGRGSTFFFTLPLIAKLQTKPEPS